MAMASRFERVKALESRRMRGLAKELYEAEQSLTDPATRQSRSAIEQLLHPGFTEIGSTGNRYSRAEMIELMLHQAPGQVVIADFEVERLSTDTALVTYRSIGGSGQEARRCSIWTMDGGRWRMRYHQGTRVPNRWGPVG